MSKKRGFIDSPISQIEEDLFDVTQYVDGLNLFIKECNTPMTIAIQGDWGSGKTSFMNLVKSNLNDDAISVWFNTWQFSQFNMEKNLAVTFLTYIIDVLEHSCEEKNLKIKLKKSLQTIGIIGAKTTGVIANMATGGSDAIEKVVDNFLQENQISAIDELKNNFEQIVNEICKSSGKSRIVFFIDDLDRLQPLRAVELLEVLKVFLECENCVFVLAIDYEVVSQGIKEKYKGSLDDKKSRKFFEKIIQVPFKMPIAHYNIDKYIDSSLKEIGIQNEKYQNQYVDLIQNSIGYNPRTMKRTFNAFLLLRKVQSDNEQLLDELGQVLLFGCLCLQLNYENVYNYIVLHLEEDERRDELVVDRNFFDNIKANGICAESCGEELYGMINSEEDYANDQLEEFLKVFCKLLVDHDKQISDSTIDKLKDILRMTSVTATGNQMVSDKLRERRRRKPKRMEEEYKEYTLTQIIEENISLNGCKIQMYRLGKDEYKKEKMVDVLQSSIEYAYAYNPEKFKVYYERERTTSFFDPDKTSKPESSRIVTENNYKISILSNNNQKRQQIQKIFKELDISTDDLVISMKRAYED